MNLPWSNRVAKRSRRSSCRRRCRGKADDHRALRIEPLESRELLSVAVPHHIVRQAADGTPMGFASPNPLWGYTPAQIRRAYGFDKITFGNGTIPGDGAGTTIAIVDAYDNPRFVDSSDPNFLNSDLHQFDVQFGLPDPPSFRKVDQRGGKKYPPAEAGWAGEIALDVEWAHAIAPKANILLVESDGPFGTPYYYSDLYTAVDYARRQPGVVAVSMSFGRPEDRFFFPEQTTYDPIFQTPAGHQGVTFLASTGDSGAPGGYPAYSPNVVAVGGTSLFLDNQGNYQNEFGWGGSGGGMSLLEPQPAYQKAVIQSPLRSIPDVSLIADPSTGVWVYDTYERDSYMSFPVGQGAWFPFGGTSASAPMWAGLIAIADQGRALIGKGSLDGPTQTLPMLYSLPSSDFHDITVGANGYLAGPGYDLVTGLGTPVADLLVKDLVGTVPTVPAPVVGPAPSANAGGPYAIKEGDSLSVDGSKSAPASPNDPIVQYQWDLNNDGVYDVFATSATTVVPWSKLFSLGVNNGPAQYTLGLRAKTQSGALGTATATVDVADVLPTVSLGGPRTINEGSAYNLALNFSDPGADPMKFWTITWGDGTTSTIPNNPRSAMHMYGQSSRTYTITATATSQDGTFPSSNTVSVTVADIAPVVTSIIPGAVVPVQNRTFTGTFTDPGLFDTHRATWTWGDGTPATTATIVEANGSGTAAASHVYANVGTYTVTLTVAETSGLTGTMTRTVTVGNVALQPDPVDPAKTALVVAGTSGNDSIVFGSGGPAGTVQVAVNGRIVGTYAPTGHLIAYGLGGNDKIMVGNKIALAAWLFGGDGVDQLVGGAGRNLLIGGAGTDRLTGGSDNDLIIGGTTAFDGNEAALAAIMSEWESNASFADRTKHLLGTLPGGRNGGYLLQPNVTVFDDNAGNALSGGAASDMFFANWAVRPNDRTIRRDTLLDRTAIDLLIDLDYLAAASAKKKV